MTQPLHNPRTPEADVDAMFCDRWSPRSFTGEPVSEDQFKSLLEAARWAPSCYNEQPWLFIVARKESDRKRFAEILSEKNRQWATSASILMFLVTRKRFSLNDKPNSNARFDAGAAWMALALQARKLGLHAHAMAGYDREKAYIVLGVPEEEYDITAAVAVGRRAGESLLPDDLRGMEKPSPRKPLGEVYREGGF